MESTGKYRIPVFNILEKNNLFVTLAHPKYTLAHPRELFDVIPFVDGRCKTPIGEIQAAIDGAISHEQAVKFRQCLNQFAMPF